MSGATSITAGVYNGANQLIDPLATNLAVSPGDHSLTWSGTAQSGAAIPAGTYSVELTSEDGEGNVSTQSVPVTILPVTVSDLTASLSKPTAEGSESLNYKLNGTASVTATVSNANGTIISTLLRVRHKATARTRSDGTGQDSSGQAVGPGTYRVTISSTDAGGDLSQASIARSIASIQLVRNPPR